MTADKCLSSPVSGLLYVKVPALGRKRGLPTWKVWKDFWVTAKAVKISLISRGLQLNFSPIKFMHSSDPDSRTTKIYIAGGSTVRRASSRSRQYVFAIFPPNSSVASIFLAGRSESESQRWIYDFIRFLDPNFINELEPNQFEVTTLPGPLSAELGLSGIMGRLGIRNSGIALREPSRSNDHQGKLLGAWGWRQIDHARCRLAAAALPEDDGKICVIRTTSLFPGGAGDLTVFCSKGRQLVRSLQNKTANIFASFHSGVHHRSRRLSRSEGDLRVVCAEVARHHASQSEEATLAMSLPQRNSHLGTSINTPVMGLAVPISRARCHSESTREPRSPSISPENCSRFSSNDSSTEDNILLDDDIDSDDNLCAQYMSEKRRVSNVSVASGVYETIDDGSDDERHVPHVKPVIPPPLPPREYKQYERHRRGGLHAFFRIQRLWRSNSENHVSTTEEDEESENCNNDEVIYSEVLDPTSTSSNPQEIPKLKLPHLEPHFLSSSCSNLPKPSLPHISNIEILHNKSISKSSNCVINSEMDSNCNSLESPEVEMRNSNDIESESLYMPMNVSRSYDRHRISSESGISVNSNFMDNLSSFSSVSDDSIYVTMNSDRKASLTSEIYALVTGLEPNNTSCP